MPAFSPGTDKIVTFVVRFVCGAIIGAGIWAFHYYSDIMSMFADGAWKSMLFWLLVWSVGVGLIFGFTSEKDDRQWLE